MVWILNQLRTFFFTAPRERLTLLRTRANIDNNLLDLCEPVLKRTLHFGSNSFDTDANTNVLNATIEYIISTKRFDELLFQ